MNTMLRVTCRHANMTVDLESLIEKEADKLCRFCDRISALSVVFEQPNHRHRLGGPYCARVEIDVPGRHLVASHVDAVVGKVAEPQAVVASAFHAAQHALQRYTDRRAQKYRQTAQHRAARWLS